MNDDDVSSHDVMVAVAIKYAGDWDKIFHAIKSRESYTPEDVRKYCSQLTSKAITLADTDYPEEIRRHCHKPPFVIFYHGNISLLNDPYRIMTVVGSREAQPYAMKLTSSLCKKAAEDGFIIASGLARGIDTAALSAAAPYPGRSIAILGNGVDYCYPSENKELQQLIANNGLVCSEYPGKTPPKPNHFPFRNRLLAIVSQTCLIGEVHQASGTMTTVSFALNYGRDIGVIPFRAEDHTMNNVLIKNGAAMIEDDQDLSLLLAHSKLRGA